VASICWSADHFNPHSLLLNKKKDPNAHSKIYTVVILEKLIVKILKHALDLNKTLFYNKYKESKI